MSKKAKLPVPAFITAKQYPVEEEECTKNEASLNNGRVRSFPHVRGNWASFAYIPITECDEITTLATTIKDAFDDFSIDAPIINLDLGWHVSLTRTQVLRHHWIDNFWSDLSQKLKYHDKFDLILDFFQIYTNEEKTRTFIGMKLHHTENLLQLIRDCDSCLEEYGLQTYYEDPSLHFSLAWSSGDHSTWMKKKLLPLLNVKLEQLRDKESSFNFIHVEKIEFKTGNKIYEYFL